MRSSSFPPPRISTKSPGSPTSSSEQQAVERAGQSPGGQRRQVQFLPGQFAKPCWVSTPVYSASVGCRARRQGRYVRYTVNLPDLTALGGDLLAAVLR
jgi:hypothetical protein